jgi:hypothetical protein
MSLHQFVFSNINKVVQNKTLEYKEQRDFKKIGIQQV